MGKTYVLLDAMGIQNYIFQTGRLKVILGASLALAEWQQRCRDHAGQHGEIVTSAGGNVLAVYSGPDEDKAAVTAAQFRKECIRDAPPGMEIAWAETQAKAGEHDCNVWQRLQVELARYKAGDRPADDYPEKSQPGMPGCDFCGTRPRSAGGALKDSGTLRNACAVCRKLFLGASAFNKGKTGDTCLEKLLAVPAKLVADEKAGYPGSLERLVSYGGETEDLMAVVVVDLNDMGNRIKNLVEQNSFHALKDFSEKLEMEVSETIEAAIRSLWEDEKTRPLFSGQETEEAGTASDASAKKWPILRIAPLVAAGDDMIFALPARLWPFFVSALLSGLQQKKYPACAGIAVAKHSFPVNRLVLMAEELAANAKGYVRYLSNGGQSDAPAGKNNVPSSGVALDWHVHQETAFSSALEARRRYSLVRLHSDRTALGTGRPYLLEDFQALLEEADLWRNAKGLTGRKLFALREAIAKGPEQTRETLVHVFLRNENDKLDKYVLLWNRLQGNENDDFPLWRKVRPDLISSSETIFRTSVADLLELNEIREGLKRRNEDD